MVNAWGFVATVSVADDLFSPLKIYRCTFYLPATKDLQNRSWKYPVPELTVKELVERGELALWDADYDSVENSLWGDPIQYNDAFIRQLLVAAGNLKPEEVRWQWLT